MSGDGWRVLGASVQGAHHVRRGLPNQDALARRGEGGPNVALAVADGHGSAKHFRSGTGARLAAELTADFLLAQAGAQPSDWSSIHRLSAGHWPEALVRRWAEPCVSTWAATH